MKKTLIAFLMVIYSLGITAPVFAADEENPGAQFISTYTTNVTYNSATVISATSPEAPTVSSSVYGLTTGYGSTGPSTVMGTSHSTTFTNLLPSTTYYYKITLTGGEISTGSFTTTAAPIEPDKDNNPQFLSINASGITSNSVTLTFTTTASTVSSSVYGLTTSYESTGPTTAMNTSHSATFTGLAPATTYYYKITLTGGEISVGTFTTAAAVDTSAPTIATISSVAAQTSATLVFTTNEASSIAVFYGTTLAYGSTGPAMPLSTSHNVLISNLLPSTTYNYKIRMQDAAGNMRESANYTFTTFPGTAVNPTITAPTVTVQPPTGLTSTEAVLNATLVSVNNGTVTSRGFEWGLTTSYGFVSSVNASFTSPGTFSHVLTGLSPATTYRYRAFATNSAGRTNTSNGTFTTPASQVVSTPVTTVTTTTTSSSGGYSSPTAAGGSYCPAGLICTAITSSSISTASQQFTRNLSVGMRSDDVKALQIYLNNNGFKVAVSGAGSPGMETTYFGPATKVALMNFQRSAGITPVSGFFGPLTRAKLSGGVIANSGASSAVTGVFTAPLVLGNDNLAVKALRTILRTKGYLATYGTSGVPASASVETTYFGIETQNALKKFQCDKNVVCTGTPDTTGWGKVGPKTRAALGW